MAKTVKTSKKSASVANYENNPFFITANGITALFNLARGMAILLVVVSVLGMFNSGWGDDKNDWTNLQNTLSGWSSSEWFMAIMAILIVGLAAAMIFALFSGASSYTASRVARDQKVEFGEAFRAAFDRLWSFLWLQVIITVKLFLWSLLLVIPGIYMTFRYSLAGVAFFDEKKNVTGNAAIKESLRLTKGAWLTTFASNMLFNLLTFGALANLITASANAMLYRQFDALGDKPKPAPHWLSWVTLALPIIILGFVLTFLIALVVGIAIGGTSFGP